MRHLVAVYGSLRKGCGNHRLLEGAEYIGTGYTYDKFKMYSLGGFPALTTEQDTEIVIELYRVDDETFARLDRLEGYPDFYNRMQIAIDIPTSPTGSMVFCDVWIYYHEDVPAYHSGVVEDGDWNR